MIKNKKTIIISILSLVIIVLAILTEYEIKKEAIFKGKMIILEQEGSAENIVEINVDTNEEIIYYVDFEAIDVEDVYINDSDQSIYAFGTLWNEDKQTLDTKLLWYNGKTKEKTVATFNDGHGDIITNNNSFYPIQIINGKDSKIQILVVGYEDDNCLIIDVDILKGDVSQQKIFHNIIGTDVKYNNIYKAGSNVVYINRLEELYLYDEINNKMIFIDKNVLHCKLSLDGNILLFSKKNLFGDEILCKYNIKLRTASIVKRLLPMNGFADFSCERSDSEQIYYTKYRKGLGRLVNSSAKKNMSCWIVRGVYEKNLKEYKGYNSGCKSFVY